VNDFFPVLAAVLPIFAIAAVGAFARRRQWLTEEADRSLMRLTIHVLVPAFIFEKMLGNPALLRAGDVLAAPLFGFAAVALGIGISWLVARMAGIGDDRTRRTFAYVTGLFNYGYVPLPLALMLFDRETVGILVVFNLGVEIALWIFGGVLLSRKEGEPLLAKILNPTVVTILATLALNFSGAHPHVPGMVGTAARMIGECAIPMGLVLTGAILSDHLQEFHAAHGWRVMGTSCALRLALLPAAFLIMATYLPLSLELRRVLVLQAGMPAAVFPLIMTKHYGGDTVTAMRVIVGTSAVSIVTIPVWIRFGMRFAGL
jgi:predicted permease